MRKFLLKLLVFVAPLLAVMAAVEAGLRSIPNSYKLKYEYMEHHCQDVQTLILGSSHTYRGLDPSHFATRAFNLAYSSQDLKRDSYLFFRFIGRMDSLRHVIVPVSYHTMPEMMEDFSRSETLLKYYGIYMEYPPERMSLELTTPHWYEKVLMHLRGEPVCRSDSLGFAAGYVHDDASDVLDMHHAQTVAAWHTHSDFGHVGENMRILRRMIDACAARQVRVVLITTPVTDLYRGQLDARQLHLMHDCIDSLVESDSCVTYLDFMGDARFSRSDFQDVDHLSADGARRLSVIVSDTLSAMR